MTDGDESSVVDRLDAIRAYGRRLDECDSEGEIAALAVDAGADVLGVTATVVARRDGEWTVLATETGTEIPRDAVDRAAETGEAVTVREADGESVRTTVVVPADTEGDVAVVATGVEGTLDGTTTALLGALAAETGGAVARHRLRERLSDAQRVREEQTQLLETVASLVNHDLKTPLDVVSGQLDMAEQSGDERHFELVRTALGQIDDIVEGSVTLARRGQYVEDREELDLAALAETTWEHVDSGDATLVVETTRTVDGDKMRLLRCFEKLFENAVAHAGPSVTVTVGDCPGGFYVADDGAGIPETSREQVFDPGYSTTEAPGYGLAIAAACVRAHGWQLALGDSTAGGARFEITGVDG